jgi:hypothetical protein
MQLCVGQNSLSVAWLVEPGPSTDPVAPPPHPATATTSKPALTRHRIASPLSDSADATHPGPVVQARVRHAAVMLSPDRISVPVRAVRGILGPTSCSAGSETKGLSLTPRAVWTGADPGHVTTREAPTMGRKLTLKCAAAVALTSCGATKTVTTTRREVRPVPRRRRRPGETMFALLLSRPTPAARSPKLS